MKVRSGFVSNSSTSSFCIVGFSTAGLTEKSPVSKILGLGYNEAMVQGILETDTESGEPILGIELLTFQGSDDGGFVEDKQVSMEEFQEIVKRVTEMWNKIGANTEIKIYSGCRAC